MHKSKDDGFPSRGSIIVTASNAGLYPFPVAPLYAAAKAGLINLVRSLAPVLAKSSIQINALAPAVLGKSTDTLDQLGVVCPPILLHSLVFIP